jgi:hypothetical protein
MGPRFFVCRVGRVKDDQRNAATGRHQVPRISGPMRVWSATRTKRRSNRFHEAFVDPLVRAPDHRAAEPYDAGDPQALIRSLVRHADHA